MAVAGRGCDSAELLRSMLVDRQRGTAPWTGAQLPTLTWQFTRSTACASEPPLLNKTRNSPYVPRYFCTRHICDFNCECRCMVATQATFFHAWQRMHRRIAPDRRCQSALAERAIAMVNRSRNRAACSCRASSITLGCCFRGFSSVPGSVCALFQPHGSPCLQLAWSASAFTPEFRISTVHGRSSTIGSTRIRAQFGASA